MMKRLSSTPVGVLLCLVLTLLLSVPEGVRCALAEVPASPTLNLVIVEGEGAINNVRQRTAREPIVQVEDENHKPVAGAAVVFTLPDKGPGGAFSNGSRVLRVVSDSNGKAVAKGLRLNNISGKFQIQVDASYQGSTATTSIAQTNAVLSAAASSGSIVGQVLSVVLAVGSTIAAVVVVSTQKKGKASPNTRNPTGGR